MKAFKDKVVVITGAANGIGLGIAQRCAQEGMKIVLSDIEEQALTKTEEEMKAAGADVLAVLTDVSNAKDVEALAEKTLKAFGAVNLLFNNAGVADLGIGGGIWEYSLTDWEWIMGVNLWGVIHGVRTFVPIMLEQESECHIVNTASMAGLLSYPAGGIYKVTKYGAVTLSETLLLDLAKKNTKLKVSVLVPGITNTQIMASDRNRPNALQNETAIVSLSPEDEKRTMAWSQAIKEGMSPQQVANIVFQAIRDEKFYIFTHPEMKPLIQLRMEDILQERNPTNAFAGTDLT
jgi:NAD(P)-dependent dehydrogenase (short-subunit alcohol dehydrogenase family)